MEIHVPGQREDVGAAEDVGGVGGQEGDEDAGAGAEVED